MAKKLTARDVAGILTMGWTILARKGWARSWLAVPRFATGLKLPPHPPGLCFARVAFTSQFNLTGQPAATAPGMSGATDSSILILTGREE